jgi:CRP-like cAMP-binding protein
VAKVVPHLHGTALTLVLALQTLFPPHPLAFSKLAVLSGCSKSAPVVRRSASQAEYLTHLSPDAYGGVGALGMFPGLSIPNEKGEPRWYSPYFVVDFDKARPDDLWPLIDTFEGFALYTYPTCGTTGRGSHLYGFIEGLVPQCEVHNLMKGVQHIAKEMGLGTPEIRPSSAFDRGSPIFLPYRGALKDDYGFNPLLDPERDFSPLMLEHAPREVRRISAEALEAFRSRVAKYSSPKPASASRSGANRVSAAKDALEHLRDEFERVAPFFVESHRQSLVMGLTAYAVRALGLDADAVRSEVSAFIKGRDTDELPRRLEALERTLAKYARNPVDIAWKEYYERAGLTPPGKPGISREIRGRLELAARAISERTWRGTAGLTDRSIYVALLLVAAEHGTVHERGVAVSVSTRDLALRAGVSDKTVSSALARLKDDGVVVRDNHVKRSFTDAGTLVLIVEGVSELLHSFPLLGGLREWGHLYTHPACMYRRLGKVAAPLLIVLLTNSRPLTRPELARSLGRSSRDIRKPLERLLLHRVVSETADAFELSPAWREALERAAAVTGAHAAQNRQRAVHAGERAALHYQLSRPTTPSVRGPLVPLSAPAYGVGASNWHSTPA